MYKAQGSLVVASVSTHAGLALDKASGEKLKDFPYEC